MSDELFKRISNKIKKDKFEFKPEHIAAIITVLVVFVVLSLSYVDYKLQIIKHKDNKKLVKQTIKKTNTIHETITLNGIKSSDYDDGGYFWYYGVNINTKKHSASTLTLEELKKQCEDDVSSVPLTADNICEEGIFFMKANNLHGIAVPFEEFKREVCE